jgi:hypothetical protein
MNEKQAKERGYHFTGNYERRKEDLNSELEKLRSEGFKAVMVIVPDSPYSRGIVGVGYSIYAEKKYFDTREKVELMTRLGYVDREKARALAEYQKTVSEIETKAKRDADRLRELGG